MKTNFFGRTQIIDGKETTGQLEGWINIGENRKKKMAGIVAN